MSIPLFEDLRSQAGLARRLVGKTLLFLALFWCLDRGTGWALFRGLERYYGMDVPAQVLCVGHSQVVLGIDKVALESALGVPVAKFAIEGANTADRDMMIRYYLRRQPGSVRTIVYGVDAHTFTGSGLSSSSYRLLFPFIGDDEVRGFIRRNCASRFEFLLRVALCSPRYNELTISLAVRGWLHNWANYKPGKVNIDVLRQQIQEGRFRRIALDKENIREFMGIVESVTGRGTQLLLVYIPTVDVFNRAEPQKFDKVIAFFTELASKNRGVAFLNYNPRFEARHELFRDRIHLNRAGQREVTAQLASDMKEFCLAGTRAQR